MSQFAKRAPHITRLRARRRLPIARASRPEARARLGRAREDAEARRLLTSALDHLDNAIALAAATRRATPRCLEELDCAFDQIESYLARLVQEAALPVRCAPGCSACCTEAPPVHAIEGLRMARALLQRPDGRARVQRAIEQARSFQTLLQARLQQEASSSAPGQTQAQTHTRAFRDAQKQWRQARQACPVLGPDGRCSEYRARPLACRIYVIVDDPARCDPAHPGFATLRRPPLWVSERERAFESKLAQLGRVLGLPAVPNLQWAIARLHDDVG